MRSKRLLLSVAVLVLALGPLSFGQSSGTSTGTAATPTPEPPTTTTLHQRQERQKDRIAAGVKDGQINKTQAAHLTREERHLAREGHDMRADNGGKLSARQRATLNRQQTKMSRQIYRARH